MSITMNPIRIVKYTLTMRILKKTKGLNLPPKFQNLKPIVTLGPQLVQLSSGQNIANSKCVWVCTFKCECSITVMDEIRPCIAVNNVYY